MEVNVENCACFQFNEIDEGEVFADYCTLTSLFVKTGAHEAVEIGTGNVAMYAPIDPVLKVTELSGRFAR